MSLSGIGGLIASVLEKTRELNAFLTTAYNAPYVSALRQLHDDEQDMLMMFVFCEMMGVPNPATYYTLELQPLLMDDLAQWQERMHEDQSIFANIDLDLT